MDAMSYMDNTVWRNMGCNQQEGSLLVVGGTALLVEVKGYQSEAT